MCSACGGIPLILLPITLVLSKVQCNFSNKNKDLTESALPNSKSVTDSHFVKLWSSLMHTRAYV